MAAHSHVNLMAAEYLALERKAEFRSEYAAGQMFAMAGGTETHNLLSGNLFVALRTGFSSCRTYNSDMKVFLREDGRYHYPDVGVCCGTRLFQDDKSFFSRRNPSLRHILIVWRDRIRIGYWSRSSEEEKWAYAESDSTSQFVPLSGLKTVLRLADFYEGVL